MSRATTTRDDLLSEVKTLRARLQRVDEEDQPDHITGHPRDMANRTGPEALLARHATIDSSINAIALADLNGTLTHVNSSFLTLWGYGAVDEVLGRQAVEFWHSQDDAGKVIDVLREDSSWSGGLIAEREDGSCFDVQLSASLVRGVDGEPVLMMASFVDIAEHKRARRKLAEQQDLLRAIIEGADDRVFAKDLAGRYILTNPADAEGFGKPVEEIIGLTDEALFPPERVEQIRRDDQWVTANGEALRIEQDFTTHEGVLHTYLVRKYPRFDGNGQVIGVLGIARDITELRRAEAALIEKEDLFTSIIEGTDDRIFAKDLEGRFVLVNTAEAAGFGKSAGELLGLTDEQLLGPELAKQYAETDRLVMASGDHVAYEQVLDVPQRGPRTYSVRKYARFDRAGKVAGVLGIARDITERKHAEQALRANEIKYRTLYESAADAIFLARPQDESLIFADCNPCALRMYGCTRDGLIGQSPLTFSPQTQPNGRRSAEAALERVQSALAGTPQFFEWRHCRADGTDFDTEVTLNRLDLSGGPHVLGVVRDITERKRAEEGLRLAHFSVDHAAIATFWLSPEARVLGVNQAACKSLGYTHEEMLSMTVQGFDPDLSAEGWAEGWEELKRDGSVTLETRYRRKNGEVFPVEVTANYLEYQGQEYDVAFAHDITERKKAEEERRNLGAQIQHAQKLESLGVLAGGIAHDFNNILMGVLGNAQLGLQHLPPDSPVCDFLRNIDVAANRAADLTRQMLAYSGRGKFVVQPVDVGAVVEGLTDLLKVSISKKVVLDYDFPPNLPTVEADVTQLRQIIMNLVINASEAIGENQGTITVSTRTVDVDDVEAAGMRLPEDAVFGTYVSLSVIDDGCGMDEEVRAKLFDPFFTTKFTGRGLGLAAVQGIVRGHRGAFKLDTKPGEGTTFQVLFPASGRAVVPPTKRTALSCQPSRTGTVLIVDDEDMVLSVAQRGLQGAGFAVLGVRDGKEALKVFRREKDRIDVVLLDLTMPKLGGVEVFKEMRRIHPDVRVIVTSGYNEQDVTSQISGKGFEGFIQKPYAQQALLDKVCAAIGAK